MSNTRHLAAAGGDDSRLLGAAEAEALAAEYNTWCAFLGALGPVPLAFHVAQQPVRWAGKDSQVTAVRVIAVQPTGPHVMFLTPELADELAAMLTDQARRARTGLITP